MCWVWTKAFLCCILWAAQWSSIIFLPFIKPINLFFFFFQTTLTFSVQFPRHASTTHGIWMSSLCNTSLDWFLFKLATWIQVTIRTTHSSNNPFHLVTRVTRHTTTCTPNIPFQHQKNGRRLSYGGTNVLNLRVSAATGSVCVSYVDLELFYAPAYPDVGFIFPERGPLRGGTNVTILGSGFAQNLNPYCKFAFYDKMVCSKIFSKWKKKACLAIRAAREWFLLAELIWTVLLQLMTVKASPLLCLLVWTSQEICSTQPLAMNSMVQFPSLVSFTDLF